MPGPAWDAQANDIQLQVRLLGLSRDTRATSEPSSSGDRPRRSALIDRLAQHVVWKLNPQLNVMVRTSESATFGICRMHGQCPSLRAKRKTYARTEFFSV